MNASSSLPMASPRSAPLTKADEAVPTVWRRGVADLETPVAAYLKLAHGRPNAFLLESVEGGTTRGRYSVIGMQPDLIWRCQDGRAAINRSGPFRTARLRAGNAGATGQSAHADQRNAVGRAAGACRRWREGTVEDILAMTWCAKWRSCRIRMLTASACREGLMARPSLFAIFDNVNDELDLGGTGVSAAGGIHRGRVGAGAGTARRRGGVGASPAPPAAAGHAAGSTRVPHRISPRTNSWPAVARCKDYVMAGDAFQIVISQRFSVPFALPPFALYRSLRRINPAPFMVYLDFGAFSVVASSPRVLVRLRDGTVTIRPLAGTRRRGVIAGGRPRAGTGITRRSQRTRRTPNVARSRPQRCRTGLGFGFREGDGTFRDRAIQPRDAHIVQCGRPSGGGAGRSGRADRRVPGGNASSGAPKVRAMEIIEELEPDRRGIYAGCIGYFAANGTMDTCIA